MSDEINSRVAIAVNIERRRCAQVALNTAGYWREFANAHRDDPKLATTYAAARARFEVALAIADEIEGT